MSIAPGLNELTAYFRLVFTGHKYHPVQPATTDQKANGFPRLTPISDYRVSHPRAGSVFSCIPGAAFVEGRASSSCTVERHASVPTRGVSCAPHFLSIAGPHQRTARPPRFQDAGQAPDAGEVGDSAGRRCRGTVQ
jgi:hypothetical protein